MSKGTQHRTIRVEDELWDAAKATAQENGDNLSDILRGALRAYVHQGVILKAHLSAQELQDLNRNTIARKDGDDTTQK